MADKKTVSQQFDELCRQYAPSDPKIAEFVETLSDSEATSLLQTQSRRIEFAYDRYNAVQRGAGLDTFVARVGPKGLLFATKKSSTLPRIVEVLNVIATLAFVLFVVYLLWSNGHP
jgi:hypothetical protein